MTREELDWLKDARNLVVACHYFTLAKRAAEDTLVVPHSCQKPKRCATCEDSARQRNAEVYANNKESEKYLKMIPDPLRRQMAVQKVALDDYFRTLIARHVRKSLRTDPLNVKIFPMIDSLNESCAVPLIP